MKIFQFLLPFLAFLLATPFNLLLAVISAGAGEGNYFLAKILYPFTMLSTVNADSITEPFIWLAIIQFPLYGIACGIANVLGKLRRFAVGLLLFHTLAVVLCLLLVKAGFS